MKKKIGILAIFAAIGATLYRLGGKEGYNTKFRDIGVSLIVCLTLIALGVVKGLWQWLSLIPSFGLMFAALTTYRYGLPKPKDYNFLYYSLHGFFIALALIFYAWASGRWIGFGIRCVTCAVLIGLWSILIDWLSKKLPWKHWDEINEGGRGFILIATLFFI